MEILLYLGKAMLYSILLWCLYHVALRRHTFFQLNRSYLLGSLLASMLLPLLVYPSLAPAPTFIEPTSLPTFIFTREMETQKSAAITWELAFGTIYLLGILVTSIRLGRQFRSIKTLIATGEKFSIDGGTLVLLPHSSVGSFSFFKTIVINQNDYVHHFEPILRHEMLHVEQRHSLDILMVELMRILFWYNPVLSLFKRDLQDVHEYLADHDAENRQTYAHFLVAYALGTPQPALTNSFFQSSQIKTRITMLYKKRSSKWVLSSYLVAIVAVGTFALTVAGCESSTKQGDTMPETALQVEDYESAQKRIEKELEGKKIFTVVEQQPEFVGGVEAMYEFLGTHLKYPEEAVKEKIEGRVFLSFVVTESGEIGQITILKGLGHGCDEEAVRVLKSFPKWKPGYQDGKAINVKYNLPIHFQLGEDSKKTSLRKTTKKDSDIGSPLVLIDGKRQKARGNEAIKSIDPNDIEKVNVLKGEAATAAYGKEGAEGVIEITLKKS
ncbi:M56 family metallopeptidase [Dyadobacter tibetensis]|uniref:M56 family metallopeptidase n=1 Tax=Dyadobacter tibetensis TaxID=1211851 RepID=UPI00046FF8B9|nr:M56 family metallopeptidase [Dyadobacter tibetensis]